MLDNFLCLFHNKILEFLIEHNTNVIPWFQYFCCCIVFLIIFIVIKLDTDIHQ